MDNYTQKFVKTGLTKVSKNGVTVNSVTHSYTAVINRDANTQGTKLMKTLQLSDIIVEVVSSKTDALLFSYILKNCKKYNVLVKQGTKEPATSEYLAKKFGVTVQKVRSFIRKAAKADFVVKVKGIYFINPYVVIPYTNRLSTTENDQVANQLQIWWTSDRASNPIPSIVTMCEDELLSESASEFMKEV